MRKCADGVIFHWLPIGHCKRFCLGWESFGQRPNCLTGRLLFSEVGRLENGRLDIVGGRDRKVASRAACHRSTALSALISPVRRRNGAYCDQKGRTALLGCRLNNNFKRERIILWYQCPEGVSIYCGGWVDAQCRNNSGTQPTCEGGGAVYPCIEK